MFRVLTCLTEEHNWRLVALAAVVCLFTSVVAVASFSRAQSTKDHSRTIWLLFGAVTSGVGIWATHFVAMLAYIPSFGFAYSIVETAISLLVAVGLTGVGFTIALDKQIKWSPAIGGAVVGIGIAAMHYIGMLAIELPGRLTWSSDLAVASVFLGIVFSSLSLTVIARRCNAASKVAAGLLLTAAILSLHFIAMGALIVIPDPRIIAEHDSLTPSTLAYIVAGVAASILGMCLVAALADQRSADMVRRQKFQLDTALNNMAQGLCMFDANGCIVLFNERFAQMAGPFTDIQNGQSLLDLLKHRKDVGSFIGDPKDQFERIVADMNAGNSNTKILEDEKGGALRVVEQSIEGGGWVATFEDITESRKTEAMISHMARHDSLTDLPNRKLFREQIEQALCRLHENAKIAVMCIDLDHFKDVNDSLGHPIGDDLLKAAARRLSECVREDDIVARLGGDEFAIVQVGTSQQPTEATALASRIVDVVSAPYELSGHRVVIGVSLGVSIAPADGADPDILLKNADLALYRARTDGRGTYRFFELEMDAHAQARRSLELDLRAALVQGEFELYYQPIHDLNADEIVGFEALLRWNHPVRGMVPPLTFIPLAEETGLIVPLGEWVLRNACAEAASWSQAVRVAVNLSPVQFNNRNLLTVVLSALSSSGLSADRLELEITESVLLQDSDRTLTTLHALRNMGVRIAMDDFGTGYSSLSYLRSFPFDKIKIDKSFIGDLLSSDDALAIVRAVTGLGKSLGIATTAEGVESIEELALLRAEGCTEVQGFLFSPPRPAAAVEAMLSKLRVRQAVA